jgi:uncharacterized protein
MEQVLIDSDGHVSERDEVILNYLPEPFKGRRELLQRPIFPLGDHFHRMAEGLMDSRRAEDRGDEDRSALPTWQKLLDESGMKWSALYPTRGLYIHEWHSPEWGCAVSQGYNDWVYDAYVSKEPRLKGIALLHLLDVDAAVAELRRCVEELGFEGAVLMCGGLPKPLGDERYFPVYEEAQRLDVAVAVHGGAAATLGGESASALWQVRAMSHPSGQITSFMSMVNGGVLDAFPELRIGFLEAGCGWVPYLVDRMDRVYHGRGARLSKLMKQSPSEHVAGGRIFVHAELDEKMLPVAAEMAGRDDIFMYASDYPHESWSAMIRELDEFWERTDMSDSLKVNTLSTASQRFYHLDEAGNRIGARAKSA